MKQISEKRLSDYMAEQIADEILSGRIEGGSQLKQEELAETFQASRIPIREAFQILESQGLIVRLATRRIYTTEMNEADISLIYDTIGEIVKKAWDSIRQSEQWEEKKLLFVQQTEDGRTFAEAIYDCLDNVYLKKLMQNAQEGYVRFARKLTEKKQEINVAQEKTISAMQAGKGASDEITDYYMLLAEAVNKERRKNR